MKNLFFTICIATSLFSYSQPSPDKVEPPFWWTGMNNPSLQLMIHEDKVSEYSPTIQYPGITIQSVRPMENPNYQIINLIMDKDIKPGKFNIAFKKGGKTYFEYEYELKQRAEGSADRESFDGADVLYLITPDRFVNGDTTNDNIATMLETSDRSNIGGRHGGDIKGILSSLDYIKDLGFTAIWMNPLLENDMEKYSYHGYATTDFYEIDARFGTNEDYRELINKAEEKEVKVIMDMIVNHCGANHWWMEDLPSSDWFNYQEEYFEGNYINTNHRKVTIQDPYVAEKDLSEFVDGWFVASMPDLNQRNPYMAKYLIQNAIWWIEYSGISGIRMDTYPYPDKGFMTEWTCAVKNEYPNFNTVGEEWNLDPAIVAHWQEGKQNPNGYTSCLPSLMDFPLQAKVTEGLIDKEENFNGLVDIYSMLAKDFLYADPANMVVFPDNHDMKRFFSQLNENYDLFKNGIAYYLTVRGVPQIYYGTELLMTSDDDHGNVRSDFPGGWEGDTINAFSTKGLNDRQKEAMQFFKTILNWRKNQPAIHYGKLMHYSPKNGLYVMFRYDGNDKVMTILNKNESETSLDLSRFDQMITGEEKGKEIISGKSLKLNGTLTIPAMTPMIIDFE